MITRTLLWSSALLSQEAVIAGIVPFHQSVRCYRFLTSLTGTKEAPQMGELSVHGQDPSIISLSLSENRVCKTLSSLTMGRTGLLILAKACHFESMRTVLWDGISERDERGRRLIIPYFL